MILCHQILPNTKGAWTRRANMERYDRWTCSWSMCTGQFSLFPHAVVHKLYDMCCIAKKIREYCYKVPMSFLIWKGLPTTFIWCMYVACSWWHLPWTKAMPITRKQEKVEGLTWQGQMRRILAWLHIHSFTQSNLQIRKWIIVFIAYFIIKWNIIYNLVCFNTCR